jgi:hypothetical protein
MRDTEFVALFWLVACAVCVIAFGMLFAGCTSVSEQTSPTAKIERIIKNPL